MEEQTKMARSIKKSVYFSRSGLLFKNKKENKK